MTRKAIILEFFLLTAVAIALVFLLTIGAVRLIDRYVASADPMQNNFSVTSSQ